MTLWATALPLLGAGTLLVALLAPSSTALALVCAGALIAAVVAAVHHAEVVSTWRWEDAFNRLPEHWQTKTLFSLLYGAPPLFFLDRGAFDRDRVRISQTCTEIGGWVRDVAFAEMLSHQVLSGGEEWPAGAGDPCGAGLARARGQICRVSLIRFRARAAK